MNYEYTEQDLLAYSLYKNNDRHKYLNLVFFVDARMDPDDYLRDFVKYYYDKANVIIRKKKLQEINATQL